MADRFSIFIYFDDELDVFTPVFLKRPYPAMFDWRCWNNDLAEQTGESAVVEK